MTKCLMTLLHLDGVGRPPDNGMEIINPEAKRSLTPEDGLEGPEVGQGHNMSDFPKHSKYWDIVKIVNIRTPEI